MMFDGEVHNVRHYNRMLTREEIRTMYEQGPDYDSEQKRKYEEVLERLADLDEREKRRKEYRTEWHVSGTSFAIGAVLAAILWALVFYVLKAVLALFV